MKATILHMTNTRDGQFRSVTEVREALEAGSEFAFAGEIEVTDNLTTHMLEEAFHMSQNDSHPNKVYFKATGSLVTDDFKSLDEEVQADIMMEIRRMDNHVANGKGRGAAKYQIDPAVWNGQFSQRSTMVGDVVVVDNNIYVVAGCGFEWVAAEVILGKLTLGVNRYAPKPEINHDFDQLITD